MIFYENRWAVVTGASSGLGRGLAGRLAAKGMSLVLTGRNEARLSETAQQIRSSAPSVAIETVAADLSTAAGVRALLDHVGDRPIEVLVNNAGFGSYGPFAEADLERENQEIAVDVNAVVSLARAFLPGMIARGSGGILNVASTIAFQPGPYQAVYGASKAFVLSFSQALWAEARRAGVSVTALCPGPTRTGFVDALGADVGHTAIYKNLGEPEPVIEAGLRALDKGQSVVIPGFVNALLAVSGRLMPMGWITRVSAMLLGPKQAPIDVRNELLIHASPERIWDVLTDVEAWPSWYRACRWVKRDDSMGPGGFRWKGHPIELRSRVTESARGHSFAFTAEGLGLRGKRSFTLRLAPDGVSTIVSTHEMQEGIMPSLGRMFLAPRLRGVTQAWLVDLARAVGDHAVEALRTTPRTHPYRPAAHEA
jgi:short-subunit dehydrogenase